MAKGGANKLYGDVAVKGGRCPGVAEGVGGDGHADAYGMRKAGEARVEAAEGGLVTGIALTGAGVGAGKVQDAEGGEGLAHDGHDDAGARLVAAVAEDTVTDGGEIGMG